MIRHQLSALLSESPSDTVLRELMKTVESFGMFKGSILTFEHSTILGDILTIRSLYYYQALNRNDRTCEEILLSLHSNDDNEIYTHISICRQCYKYVQTLMEKHGLILPTDFVRINEAIKLQNTDVLSDMEFSKTHEKVTQQQSIALKLLYEKSTSEFLNISLASIAFAQSEYNIEIGALELLFGFLLNEQNEGFDIPVNLSKWEVTRENYPTSEMDFVEKTIIDMLCYFQSEFKYMATLILNISEAINTLNNKLTNTLPKINSQKLSDLLSQNLCFRYSDFISILGITYKTAIDYLRQLESHGFISNTRIGREKVFINDHLFLLLREVESDGA